MRATPQGLCGGKSGSPVARLGHVAHITVSDAAGIVSGYLVQKTTCREMGNVWKRTDLVSAFRLVDNRSSAEQSL